MQEWFRGAIGIQEAVISTRIVWITIKEVTHTTWRSILVPVIKPENLILILNYFCYYVIDNLLDEGEGGGFYW